MPSSVLAVKNTASLLEHSGQRTSRVRGSVGSDRTSCGRVGGRAVPDIGHKLPHAPLLRAATTAGNAPAPGPYPRHLPTCSTTDFSRLVWCTSLRYTHHSDGSASSWYWQLRQRGGAAGHGARSVRWVCLAGTVQRPERSVASTPPYLRQK